MNKLLMTTAILTALATPGSRIGQHRAYPLEWGEPRRCGDGNRNRRRFPRLVKSRRDRYFVQQRQSRETTPNGTHGKQRQNNITNTTNTALRCCTLSRGANGFFGSAAGFGLSATILTALGLSDLSGSVLR